MSGTIEKWVYFRITSIAIVTDTKNPLWKRPDYLKSS